MGREGEPAPTPGARALPHVEEHVHPQPSEKRNQVPRKQGFANGLSY